MTYYKTPNNALHFLSDEDIANGGESLLPHDCVPITDEEATTIRAEQEAAQETEQAANTPPPIDPVEKLRAFLAANPDVAALLNGE